MDLCGTLDHRLLVHWLGRHSDKVENADRNRGRRRSNMGM
jgi:hypothetical protein